MKVTAANLEALMYDLPVLVASCRSRRKLTLLSADIQSGVSATTISRVERGFSCDVRSLILLLRWLECE